MSLRLQPVHFYVDIYFEAGEYFQRYFTQRFHIHRFRSRRMNPKISQEIEEAPIIKKKIMMEYSKLTYFELL